MTGGALHKLEQQRYVALQGVLCLESQSLHVFVLSDRCKVRNRCCVYAQLVALADAAAAPCLQQAVCMNTNLSCFLFSMTRQLPRHTCMSTAIFIISRDTIVL